MAVDTVARALALGATGSSIDAYTKYETDTLLSAKADLVNGTVPLSQIPPAAIERIVTVANDTARFALTTAEVQLGDTVKVTATNKMYFVIDTDHLDGELGYQVYVAGKASEAVADQNGNVIDTTYVKVVSGKQLSTEDYTTAEKAKLAGLENYDDSVVRSQIGKLVDAGAKNLLKITATSQTIKGVTFTVNGDGSITANGTATNGNADLVVPVTIKTNQAYILKGCPDGGSPIIYKAQVTTANFSTISGGDVYDSTSTGEFTETSDESPYYWRFRVYDGKSVSGTFYPMLCTAEDYEASPEFVPYAPTNRELYEMILALQNN